MTVSVFLNRDKPFQQIKEATYNNAFIFSIFQYQQKMLCLD
ncbi:Uncharacterized protein dnm_082200 [Desulfonema magnum]|uniref:Uncharacterized protein n=1 Tax=Desulfonema magnum TaxID=45655 RepID=A0A975GSK9_9BACT|nr:Uncharacterized protein dnm_082200 [Desulfonema magnum]